MARFTITNLKLVLSYVNEFVTNETNYMIKLTPQNGSYSLYQVRRNAETGKVERLLFVGNAKECASYLEGLRASKWYFNNNNK